MVDLGVRYYIPTFLRKFGKGESLGYLHVKKQIFIFEFYVNMNLSFNRVFMILKVYYYIYIYLIKKLIVLGLFLDIVFVCCFRI